MWRDNLPGPGHGKNPPLSALGGVPRKVHWDGAPSCGAVTQEFISDKKSEVTCKLCYRVMNRGTK